MRYLCLAGILLVSACSIQKPISSEAPANNGTYKVQYLFEHDGCKVYRFLDQGRTVYFTNCNGQTTSFGDSTVTKNTIHRTQ